MLLVVFGLYLQAYFDEQNNIKYSNHDRLHRRKFMADLGNYHVWLSYLGIEFGRFLRHVLCYWCLDSHGSFVYRSFLGLSNADALIGRVGTVITPIFPGQSGYVKVDGDEWKAVAEMPETIEQGSKVEIISRDSIIVTVRVI